MNYEELVKELTRIKKELEDIVRELRRVFKISWHNVHSSWGLDLANRIEKAAHNNQTRINCVAVEKWKAKQAAAKAKKEVAK